MSRKVERFEDSIAWEKSMDLAVDVYELTRKRPFSRDFKLCDQVHGAAISVPANFAEGFERGTRAEFHRFLSISKASCAELRTYIHRRPPHNRRQATRKSRLRLTHPSSLMP